MGFFDFRPRIRLEGSKILTRMHWWLMFKIRWRIDFSKYIWYTSLSDWWSQNMMRICEFQNIIYVDLDSKKQLFVEQCMWTWIGLLLNPFSIPITKLRPNLQTDRISKPSIIPYFWKFPKIRWPPPKNVESTLAHPKCLISGFKLRYLILKHFSDTLCHKFFYFDVTFKFVNLHQPQYWGLRKNWLKISIISDFHPDWNVTFFLQNLVFLEVLAP